LLAVAPTASAQTKLDKKTDKAIREQARYLADKVAYEVELTKQEFADAFEINYDFLCGVHAITEQLIAKDEKAITQYYVLLDQRNADLVWLMDSNEYTKFLDNLSLYRPFQLKDGQLTMRTYNNYPANKNYEGKPKRYNKYKGEHAIGKQPDKQSFYKGRYRHTFYGGQPRLLNGRNRTKLAWAKRDDFGAR
jgi:hypothetical protein